MMPSLYDQWSDEMPKPKGDTPKAPSLYDQWSEGPATETPGVDDSWWARHGRTVEAASAAGLALLAGPRLARGLQTSLSRLGGTGEALQQAGGAVQKVFAPSTVDETAGRAAGLWRQESGTAARETAQAEAALEPLWPSMGKADEATQRRFIGYVEGRSRGVPLADPTHQVLADTMRKLYQEVHTEMQGFGQSQKMGFIQDYYRHQWIKDANSERAFSKQGQGYFTKERSIPTIEQGIAMGLKPKTLDPVQTTLEYVSNAKRFIATNKVLEAGKTSGDVILRQLGTKKPIPEGFVPLEGHLAKRGGHQLYAREGWARVYNNFISSGFTGAAGDIVNSMRRASNTVTAFELGMSGFHATTMVNEAIVNDVARAVIDASKGKVGEAFKTFIKAPTAPVRQYRTGKKLEEQYLGVSQTTPEMRKITDLLTKAGGRAKGMMHAKDYEYTSMGTFYQALKRGTLGAQFKQYGTAIAKDPLKEIPATALSLLSRTIQQVSAPLFNNYIPRIKNGAFYDTMGQWLKSNPTAAPEQELAMARRIWDSIDNRFGELVQDNIFWKQHMKQIAMLSMRSYSWNVGTIREIGGGLMDIAKHEMSPRAAYAIALPITYGTIGAIYQYLKTGEKPQDTHDLVAPRTGGTDPATGLPERMVMPGYMKDVFGWYEDPVALAGHKLATAPSTALHMATGRDWKGDPIAPPSDDPSAPYEQTAPAWLRAYFGYAAQTMVPMTVRDIGQGRKVGTAITPAEQFFGMRPAGRRYVDPEGYEGMQQLRKVKEWRTKERREQRQKSYYEGVEE